MGLQVGGNASATQAVVDYYLGKRTTLGDGRHPADRSGTHGFASLNLVRPEGMDMTVDQYGVVAPTGYPEVNNLLRLVNIMSKTYLDNPIGLDTSVARTGAGNGAFTPVYDPNPAATNGLPVAQAFLQNPIGISTPRPMTAGLPTELPVGGGGTGNGVFSPLYVPYWMDGTFNPNTWVPLAGTEGLMSEIAQTDPHLATKIAETIQQQQTNGNMGGVNLGIG